MTLTGPRILVPLLALVGLSACHSRSKRRTPATTIAPATSTIAPTTSQAEGRRRRALDPLRIPLTTEAGDNLHPYGAMGDPCVRFEDGRFKMWFTALASFTPAGRAVLGTAYSESLDGITWDQSFIQPDQPGDLAKLRLSAPAGAWDEFGVETPSVVRGPSGRYFLYYTGNRPPAGDVLAIGLATSDDGITWERYGDGPLLEPRAGIEWEQPSDVGGGRMFGGLLEPTVVYDWNQGKFLMWYAGVGERNGVWGARIGYATSVDGVNWDRLLEPVLETGAPGSWDGKLVTQCDVSIDPQGGYHMFYAGAWAPSPEEDAWMEELFGLFPSLIFDPWWALGHAYSRDGINWERNPSNPLLWPNRGGWDGWMLHGPSVILEEHRAYMWYFSQRGATSDEERAVHFGMAQVPLWRPRR